MPRSFLVKKTERRWSSAALTTERWSVGQFCQDDHDRLTAGLRDVVVGASVPIATDNVINGSFFGLTSSSDCDDTLCPYSVSGDQGSASPGFYGYVEVTGAPHSPLGTDQTSGSDETDQSDVDHQRPEAEVSDVCDASDISQDSVDVPSRKDLIYCASKKTNKTTKKKKTSQTELFPPSRPTVRHYSFDAFTDGRFKKSSSLSPSSPKLREQLTGVTEPPSYSCEECGRHYATSSNLSRHRQTHRSLDSQHAKQCPHCRKVYVSMPALAMHVLTHDLKYRCSVCAKAFSRPWLLRGHLRSHTGEKPFGCAHCGKAFADRSNLRAHMQTHSALKHFRCQRCDKSFALKSYLNKHHELACGQE